MTESTRSRNPRRAVRAGSPRSTTRSASRLAPSAAIPSLNSTLAPAAGDIVMAACQRSLALHAQWINESVSRALDPVHTPDGQGQTGFGAQQQGEWMRMAVFEPTWHYLVGLMSLGRSTGDSMVSLLSSQMRGAHDEVDSLSRDAHEQAVDAAQDAASAAVAALSRCAQAVSQLGERATHMAQQAAQRAAQSAQGSDQSA